jgi:trehalose utilization protein
MHDSVYNRENVKVLLEKAGKESDDTDNMYVDRMKLLAVTRGTGRQSTLQGKARKIFNEITTGTISVNTLRWRLKEEMEHVWVNDECSEVYS